MKDKEWFFQKNILVLGLAKSGLAAARLLKQLGANVTVNEARDLNGSAQEEKLQQLNIPLISGGHPLYLVDESLDYVVKNPGIRYDNPIVKAALEQGLPVVTEIELADVICEGDILAISGSNGKTTTTTLIHEMLHESGKSSYLAGNIGKVACEVAEIVKKDDVMVTEVSSFQLKGTEEFHPRTAVLLNIFDAHLDYHGGREDYEMSKGKIFKNMNGRDSAVYNAEDSVVTQLAQKSDATLIPFSVHGVVTDGAYVKDDVIYFRGDDIMTVQEAALPGKHNQENMLAAIAAAMIHGADKSAVRNVLMHFHGIEHRLQFAGSLYGRKIYNDSKATNILSTQKAIEAFKEPVVLLAGGLDRGNVFDELIPSLKNVKAAVFYGETKDKLAKAAESAGITLIETTETLDEAVQYAYPYTEEGDVLLLSPACASWDQFKTFEERGAAYLKAVEKIRSNVKSDLSG
ncbi:UDP-N-acetylmuramoyl-L-alanine--D-glutamate ligase [Salibacterium salarium]|uniref:UDP-N-acetylmuramoylalanine--D-glutamate ligase n=1 Tax=Salibacterium salarium TaxID=284579 RepID=A0A3R9P6E1_9BACI|nr:UDP-N-acetylmuramoyl-L-alanine--D-glutamate ligase [Salibacterium salarium]RSL31314.1 UDP-N-acetylmuramoyl-L-alanine--D-glutamate ligase [Salibacterium salarium]